MNLEQLLGAVRARQDIEFDQVMAVIEDEYRFVPGRFSNGLGPRLRVNEADENQGSCKLFAFARLHQLDEAQTLALFGRFYREDVLNNPDGDDHMNIRTFMVDGWQGVVFEHQPLLAKSAAG